MKENNKINTDYDEYIPSFEYNEDNQIINFDKSSNSNNSSKISNSKTKKNEENSKNEEKEKEIKIGNYLIKKTLGKGTFGKVKLGIYLPRNKKVAIKILEKNRIKEEDDRIRLRREFEMLSQFNHPNVITVSEIFESNKEYFTVMEFCEGGELFNLIVANKRLSEEKSAFFFYQLINGLEYIHSLGIVHRDLKPENLLLTKDNILKIIDFGLSNYFKDDQPELLETPCGSPCYASPEMLSGRTYDGFKIDIWATGIILFAMLCGFLPFDDKDNNILFQKILECKITFPKFLSLDAKDLLKKILVMNPLKRINIQNIKKHPFYLKGKEIFEKNFTIYQVSAEDIIDSEDSSYFYNFKYMNENSFINNFLYYEFDKKSEIIINRLQKEEIFCLKSDEKRSNSFQINNQKNTNNVVYDDKNRNRKLKKLIDLEKKIKKMKKININGKKETKKIKDECNDFDEDIKRNSLNYNRSITFHIKDINTFIENLIIQYKIEEDILNRLNKLNLEKNKKFIKPKKKNKSEDNTKQILKNKIDKNKKLKKKEINNEKEKSSDSFNTLKKLITQNKKLSINFNNMNTKNNKSNTKKTEPAKLNKIFINNNHIIKINKLQQSLKFQKPKRKTRSTSINNSNKKNLKNILNMIKENSLKSNYNFNSINKQNVIHHHTTNITNMTQKNYFSNVIINNYKTKDEHRLNSTCKHRCNILFESPNDKVDKNIKIKDYFQKNTVSNMNQMKKYNLKNLKLKTNLQKMKTNLHKMILKDENLLKNSVKLNSKKILNNTEEVKSQNNSIIKNKKFQKMTKEIESKTIQNAFNKKKKQYKIRVSFVNNNDLTNNKICQKNLYLKSESSLKNYSMSKERHYDAKDSFSKYPMYKGRKYRILLADINLDEETINKGRFNYISSTENSGSYRSQSKNYINLLDKNKVCNKSNKNWHKTYIKKIDNENMKRNSFGSKNIINFKKFKKIDIKDIISNNSNNYIVKTEANSISHHKKMYSQRTKSSGKNNLRTNNYLNSARIIDKKLINTSCNYINNQHYPGNMTENKQTYNNNSHVCSLIKFKINHKNMRSKNVTSKNYNYLKKNHVVNITNDNIKYEKNKNQNQNQPNNKEINTLNYRRTYKNIGEKRRTNTNIYFDKFLDSKKLLASLKKRINVKSMLINNIYDKKKENKAQKNSKKNNKENENKMNNNSAITNFSNNVKQFNTNKNNNIKKKFLAKNNFEKNNDNLKLKKDLSKTLQSEKPKFKKLKTMKETIMNIKSKFCKKKLNLKSLNIENNNINNNSIRLYFYNNTELNSTYSNNNNTNENSLFKSPIIKSKNIL